MKAPLHLPVLLVASIAILLAALPGAAADVIHDYYGPYGGDDWIDIWEDYEKYNKSHGTPPFSPRQSFGGCYIADKNYKLIEDLDCDAIPDPIDNCIGVANTDQLDQNQNGLGDACDLVVDVIEIDPPVVMEGRAFLVTAKLTNYRPFVLRNVELTVQVPELGLEQQVYVDRIEPGEQGRYEFFFRLPGCVRTKEYDTVLFIAMPKGPGTQEFFYIPTRMAVSASGLCEAEPTTRGKTIVNIIDIQDVDPIDGAVYPFTIINNEFDGQAYVLSVEGLDDWGEWEIRPRTLIVVPPGESREGELVVFTKPGASGEQGFLLTLTSKRDAQQLLLTARALQEQPGMSRRLFLQFGLFIVALILILFGFALSLHRAHQAREAKRRGRK